MSRDHRKLRAFHEADDLVPLVYRITTRLPVEERYGLRSQIRRAAVSAVTNIVEGCARPKTRDYCHFLMIAHGSARECGYLLGLCVRLEMLAQQDVARHVDRYAKLDAMLLSIVMALDPEAAQPSDTRACAAGLTGVRRSRAMSRQLRKGRKS